MNAFLIGVNIPILDSPPAGSSNSILSPEESLRLIGTCGSLFDSLSPLSVSASATPSARERKALIKRTKKLENIFGVPPALENVTVPKKRRDTNAENLVERVESASRITSVLDLEEALVQKRGEESEDVMGSIWESSELELSQCPASEGTKLENEGAVGPPVLPNIKRISPLEFSFPGVNTLPSLNTDLGDEHHPGPPPGMGPSHRTSEVVYGGRTVPSPKTRRTDAVPPCSRTQSRLNHKQSRSADFLNKQHVPVTQFHPPPSKSFLKMSSTNSSSAASKKSRSTASVSTKISLSGTIPSLSSSNNRRPSSFINLLPPNAVDIHRNRVTKMAKLIRKLGECPPPEMVFGSPQHSDATSSHSDSDEDGKQRGTQGNTKRVALNRDGKDKLTMEDAIERANLKRGVESRDRWNGSSTSPGISEGITALKMLRWGSEDMTAIPKLDKSLLKDRKKRCAQWVREVDGTQERKRG